METLRLHDNSSYLLGDAFLPLKELSDRPIADLSAESNLLVFPHSFAACKDKIGRQPILRATERWERGVRRGLQLQLGNIAGFIGFRHIELTVSSRFAQRAEEDYFLHYLLQKTLAINLFDLKHRTGREGMLDLLLYLFPDLLNAALRQGVFKTYIYRHHDDANVKGVLDPDRQIRRNTPFNGKIAYRTREFSYDNPLTQLVRHTIEYLRVHRFGQSLLRSSARVQADSAQIVQATPTYRRQERQEVIRHNLRPLRHPYFTAYEPLRRLCIGILLHRQLKFGAADERIHGILFDVAWLWENYLTTLLVPLGFRHPDNGAMSGRICLARSGKFPRYPDFYDRESRGVVIDAKYKREPADGDASRNDINQMVTYLYRLQGRRGIFILPSDQPQPPAVSHSLRGYGEAEDDRIVTFHCPVPQEAASFAEFRERMQRAEEELVRFVRGEMTET